MTDHTNSGCACTPNTAIRCAVTNCANHCKEGQYCGLNAIQVGTHEAHPTMDQCTDCQSFKKQQPFCSRPPAAATYHQAKRGAA